MYGCFPYSGSAYSAAMLARSMRKCGERMSLRRPAGWMLRKTAVSCCEGGGGAIGVDMTARDQTAKSERSSGRLKITENNQNNRICSVHKRD